MRQTTLLLKEVLSPLYDDREVRNIIRYLLEEVCGWTYTEIVMYSDCVLPEESRNRLAGYAAQLAQGIPLQQVLGYTWFRGRKFGVNPNVLIPRPETEGLVDKVVDNYVSMASSTCQGGVDKPVYNLVDIGTGSGCIALSLAADIPNSFITAVDLSTEALITAQNNAKQLNINNVRFIRADILKEESEDFSTELSTIPDDWQKPTELLRSAMYDAIVSNPPYICRREAVDMSPNVLDHEPHLALFVPDEDPLLFYRVIAHYGLRHLKPGGRLYYEINEAYGPDTCQLLCQLGYQQVELMQDFTGRDRMVVAAR